MYFATHFVFVDCAAIYQHPGNFSDVSTRKISSADMNRIQEALESAILNASSPLPAPTAWVSIHKNKPRRASGKQAQGGVVEQPKTVRIPPLASLSIMQADTIPCPALPCPADIDDLLPAPPHNAAPTVYATEETERASNPQTMPADTTNDVSETPDASGVSVVVAVDVVVSDSPPPARTLQRQKINPNQIHKSTPHAITLPLSGRAVWIAALALLGAIGGLLAQTW